MIFDIALLIAGCALLYLGADRLISGAIEIGRRQRLSPALTGLLIVAVGTSLPELAVAVDAALRGHGVIAVGSVVGSNIVNISLVLGAAAVIGALPASSELRRVDLPVLCGLTLCSAALLADGELGRLEGLLLAVAVAAFLLHRLRDQAPGAALTDAKAAGRWRPWAYVLAGVVLLVAGAEAMVSSGLGLARDLGVSEAVIALTVTAIGTGIPEIAATLVAVTRRQHALALGNIIGSNLMNLGMVLGISSLLAPMSNAQIGWLPLLTMAALPLTLWLLLSAFPAIQRWGGLLLLVLFGAYQVALVA